MHIQYNCHGKSKTCLGYRMFELSGSASIGNLTRGNSLEVANVRIIGQ